MLPILGALVSGLLFGLGLTISHMTDPARVLAFLDLFGAWNPSLAFVMAGAVAVAAVGFALARRLEAPLLAPCFQIPTRRDIDIPLVAGSALFGIGWGLVGLCPGPALTDLSGGLWQILVFVAAMIAGMAAFRLLPSPPSR